MWRIGIVALGGCTALIKSPGQATSAPVTSSSSDQHIVEAGPRIIKHVSLPVPDRPTDPWSSVRGDQPILFDDALGTTTDFDISDQPVECTAARDHCLPALSWMWIHEGDNQRVKGAHVVAITSDGVRQPIGAKGTTTPDRYTAYRTVPATRQTLVEGTLALAHPKAVPASPEDAWAVWALGPVERVDWDLGFFWFAGDKEPRFVTSARVAVLSWTPGAKVTIVGTKQRNELAVKVADVIVPEP
ncbi:MAG: hypothetical protein H0T46_26725 [Deltaproteobacteria bacterium]|nr:hypothetical protein [Deltaproteobacteria bacterium]